LISVQEPLFQQHFSGEPAIADQSAHQTGLPTPREPPSSGSPVLGATAAKPGPDFSGKALQLLATVSAAGGMDRFGRQQS
jgi:hypothetical protein